MNNEPYYDLSHDEACVALLSHFTFPGYKGFLQVVLPNRKIADLLIITPNQDIEIFEVKTFYRDSYFASAMHKYGAFCHRLWLAVPHLTKAMIDNAPFDLRWPQQREVVGLIGVERTRHRILKSAQRRPLGELRHRLVLNTLHEELTGG